MIKFALLASAAALLSACTASESPGVVPEDEIVAIMACLMSEACIAPGETVIAADGSVLQIMTVPATDGFIYQYFVHDRSQAFGVVVSNGSAELGIILVDADLDGKVDGEGRLSNSDFTRRSLSERDAHYAVLQKLYVSAMSLTEQIVPQELRDAISKVPEDPSLIT